MYLIIVTLLIFGYTSHGITLEEALKLAECLVQCKHESCENQCNQNFMSTKAPLTRLSISANFNATLHCRDIDLLTLAHNPGIFVIEQKTLNNISNEVTVHRGKMSVFSNLLPDTRYQYHVHRVNADGISMSETTEWFATMKVAHQLQSVKAISVKNIVPEDETFSHLKAEIVFEPDEDRCCFYDIVWWSDRNGLSTGHVNVSNHFRFNLRGLDYDNNNTVIISATHKGISRHSNNISISFNTPSCLDVHKNITICAPHKVDGLHINYIQQFGTRGKFVITWNKPIYLPDTYTIQILTLDGTKEPQLITVPGNSTEVFYPIVDDAHNRYLISIIAESRGGTSVPSSIIKALDNPRNNLSIAPRENIIIIITSIVVVIIVGIFACIYFRCKKKSHYEHQIKYCENLKEKVNLCSSYEKSLKSPSDIDKKSESDYLIHKDDFEISPIDLSIKNELGSGITGVVRLGLLRVNDNKTINVAVKMLRDCPSADELRCLQQEIMIMKSAGTHPNIVSMIGYSTFNTNPMLIVEYCNKGDLQNYLRRIWKNILTCADIEARWKIVDEARNNNTNKSLITHWNQGAVSNQLYDIEQDTLSEADNITAEDLLSFARQVANGMEYLSLNRIVHRDLAARNVLVCDDRIVKISDFGLSRDVYRENVYKKRGNEKLPLKWMAIEALTHQIYTTQSDVWSFGILLWEIVTLGSNPYPDIPTNMILQYLKSEKRMGKPSNCGDELYSIMTSCWRSSPRSRPTFTELKNSLDKLLLNVSKREYVNFCDVISESREEEQRLTPKSISPLDPMFH